MALRSGDSARTPKAERRGSRAGPLTPLRIVLLAVGGTLLALAVLVWTVWRDGDGRVVIDVPAASSPGLTPGAAGDDGDAPAEAVAEGGEAVSDPTADEAEAEAEAEAEVAAGVGDPAFFETPMRVVRFSNIRSQPTPGSAALGRAEEGTMVILVDPKPDRGYYRVATGEYEGWIWGANLEPADPSQQPDAPDDASAPAGGAADDEGSTEAAGRR